MGTLEGHLIWIEEVIGGSRSPYLSTMSEKDIVEYEFIGMSSKDAPYKSVGCIRYCSASREGMG